MCQIQVDTHLKLRFESHSRHMVAYQQFFDDILKFGSIQELSTVFRPDRWSGTRLVDFTRFEIFVDIARFVCCFVCYLNGISV